MFPMSEMVTLSAVSKQRSCRWRYFRSSVGFPRFLWRRLLGRGRWSFWFGRRRRMLRRLCGWRRSGRPGFRFRGGLLSGRRYRPCWLRMCRRTCRRCRGLSAPLGWRRGAVRPRCRRSGFGCRRCRLNCFPHGFSRPCRRRSERTGRRGSGPGFRSPGCRSRFSTIRLRARRRRSRGCSRASGNHGSNWFAFGDGLRRCQNGRSSLIHRSKLLAVLRRGLPLL